MTCRTAIGILARPEGRAKHGASCVALGDHAAERAVLPRDRGRGRRDGVLSRF